MILFSILDSWGMKWTVFTQTLNILRILGTILTIAGLLIRYTARKALGKHYSVHVATSSSHKLVTEGIYHIIRHPAYLGLLCLFIGIPLCFGSWGGLGIAIIGGIPSLSYRITVEEKYLEAWFGKSFQSYQKKTWHLLPYIW